MARYRQDNLYQNHDGIKIRHRVVLNPTQQFKQIKLQMIKEIKTMKKTILAATVIIMSTLLTACGGGETKGSEPVSATDTTTVAIEATKAENMEAYNFYELARDASTIPYEISDKAGTFLKAHGNLFPISADKFLKDNDSDLVDFDLDAKHILKNKEKYGDMLIALPELGVTQIWEDKAENSDGYYSVINATDPSSGQQYIIIYNGSLDVFENDYISCFGLPLDTSSFENTDGGGTLVIVLAGSVIEKIQDDATVAQETLVSVAETVAQAQPEVQNNSDLTGTWLLKMNDDDVNVIDISYDSSEGNYYAVFNGSYGDVSGYTEGPIYDNGDGTWRYYDSNDMAAGSDNPAFMISLDNDSITVTSVMGDTYGGMNFPGFAGTYKSW